ncbi:major facilitator superfamily domain-containing protein, partial [Blyttiomyces helicus]
MLIIARALQGAGAALTVPSSVGILGSCYEPGKRRNRVFACFTAGAPIGFVLGLVLGGVYTERVNWRWMFYTTAALSLAFFVLALLYVPHHAGQDGGDRRIDVVGAILSTVGLMLFTYALSAAEFASNGWSTPYIVAFLVCSVFIVAGFLLFESRIDYPLMPLSIWKYRRFALINFVAFCGWGAFNSFVFYATLFFQNVQQTTPLETTARFIPMAVVGVAVNVVMAMSVAKIPGRILLMIAMAAFTGSSVLFALSAADQNYWSMPFPALCLVVVGADTLYCLCSLFVMVTVLPKDQSVASGIFNTVLSIGISVALAITSATAGTQTASSGTPLESYRAAFWTCAGIAGLGFLAAAVGADIGIAAGSPSPVAAEMEEINVDGSEQENPKTAHSVWTFANYLERPPPQSSIDVIHALEGGLGRTTMLATFQIGGIMVALPTIGQTFAMTPEMLQWIPSAYFISQSATMLIIARALQGAGAAMTVPSSVGILGSCYKPGERRNRAFACFTAGSPIGFVVGLVLGGVYTQTIGWRWTFYTTAALSLAFFFSALFFVPHHDGQKGGDRRVDVVGATLSTVGLLLFTYAL